MSAQHTPGHWVWGPNARQYADPNLPECQRVMNVHLGKTTALCWDERDARLIAAAPDLLAAAVCALADFEGILPEFDPEREHPAWETLAELRAAITKATGETA